MEGVFKYAGISENYGNEYYVLKSIFNENYTIFAPVKNKDLKIRLVLSAEEIYDLVKSTSNADTIWIEDEPKRREHYKMILENGDRAELIQLIKTLHLHKEEQKEKKQKVYISDEQFMKDAEKLLYEEFAYVLNIDREDVLSFILKQTQIEGKSEKSGKSGKSVGV